MRQPRGGHDGRGWPRLPAAWALWVNPRPPVSPSPRAQVDLSGNSSDAYGTISPCRPGLGAAVAPLVPHVGRRQETGP